MHKVEVRVCSQNKQPQSILFAATGFIYRNTGSSFVLRDKTEAGESVRGKKFVSNQG